MLAYAACGAIVSGIFFLVLVVFICWLAYQSIIGDKRVPSARNARKLNKIFAGKSVQIKLILANMNTIPKPFAGSVESVEYQRGAVECFVVVCSDKSQYCLSIQDITDTSISGYLIDYNGWNSDRYSIVLA